jgi:hypothetical protein
LHKQEVHKQEVHKEEVLPLQCRLRVAGVRVTELPAPEVVDELAAAEVEAARRCTPLQPVRRT